VPKTGNYAVEFKNLDECLKLLNEAQRNVRGMGGYSPNYDIRGRAQQVAAKMLPDIKRAIGGSPAPQAAGVAGTARAKRDRIPVVRIGAVNPKLSGFRKRRASNRRGKGSVAWGVERGPAGGHRAGSSANFYGVPRVATGYAIQPRLPKITAGVVEDYQAVVADVLRRSGVI
jgi:hypothetical protein